jgi:hypothetical protein
MVVVRFSLLFQVNFPFHVSGINVVIDFLEAGEDVSNFCEELSLSGICLVRIVTNLKFFPFVKLSFAMFLRFFEVNV